MFFSADVNEDCVLTLEEFRAIYPELREQTRKYLIVPSDVNLALQEVDLSGDDIITLNEMMDWMWRGIQK